MGCSTPHRANANTTIQCPVEKGTHKVTQTVTLPKEIPPGRAVFDTVCLIAYKCLFAAQFNVAIRGFTDDDEDLVCMDLMMDFRLRAGSYVPW